MGGMLEGKEMEGKIGEVGNYYVDVTKEGGVKIGVSIEAKVADGDVTVKSDNSAEAHVLTILEKIAAKNDKTWDEAVIAQVKMLLGLVG